MKPITTLSLSNDAIRAAVIANPYTERPQILQYRTIGLPTGAVVDGGTHQRAPRPCDGSSGGPGGGPRSPADDTWR